MSRPAVIVDIDGTLVDVSGIRHYVLDDPRKKDFHKFHAAASYATPVPTVVELVRAMHRSGLCVIVLSSRKGQWRYRTRVWLRKWDVPFTALGMRGDQDTRRDDVVKRDLYEQVRLAGYKPVLAIDDNPIVVDLWQSLGIPTVVVPGWITPSQSTSTT